MQCRILLWTILYPTATKYSFCPLTDYFIIIVKILSIVINAITSSLDEYFKSCQLTRGEQQVWKCLMHCVTDICFSGAADWWCQLVHVCSVESDRHVQFRFFGIMVYAETVIMLQPHTAEVWAIAFNSSFGLCNLEVFHEHADICFNVKKAEGNVTPFMCTALKLGL